MQFRFSTFEFPFSDVSDFLTFMPTSDTKVETSVDATPTGSPPVPEPEYHFTFVDSTLAPVSLFRQIWERLREPKFTAPKKYTTIDSSPVPGAEFHPTFVDSTLPPVSLFRQILERFREPKITVPKEYYRGKGPADTTSPASSAVPGAEFHATFVESTLPPVSLFRQILAGLREPKITVPKKYYRGKGTLPATDLPPPVPEDPNQLNLPFEKPKAPSFPLTSKPVDLPEGWAGLSCAAGSGSGGRQVAAPDDVPIFGDPARTLGADSRLLTGLAAARKADDGTSRRSGAQETVLLPLAAAGGSAAVDRAATGELSPFRP